MPVSRKRRRLVILAVSATTGVLELSLVQYKLFELLNISLIQQSVGLITKIFILVGKLVEEFKKEFCFSPESPLGIVEVNSLNRIKFYKLPILLP